MAVQVYKFGGSSTATPERLQAVGELIQQAQAAGESLAVVISAVGKTTSQLERLAEAARSQAPDTQQLYQELQNQHHYLVAGCWPAHQQAAVWARLQPYWDELDQLMQGVSLLGDFPRRVYDRLMAYGELLSSTLLAAYLEKLGVGVCWLDARQLVLTDSQWRQARVLRPETTQRLQQGVQQPLQQGLVCVLQGYIGANSEGHTTTLGREGSDYTAALLAGALGARQLTLWKDVPGVMSADPREIPEAVVLPALSYSQAAELTFYGASVLHPQTLRPLREGAIPLRVRSFLNPAAPGTHISANGPETLPPITLYKRNQSLLLLQPLEFAYLPAETVQRVFDELAHVGLQVNLLQRQATRLALAVDTQEDALTALQGQLAGQASLEMQHNLVLETRLHHPPSAPAQSPPALVEQWMGELQQRVIRAGA